jgi:hypothetical protein
MPAAASGARALDQGVTDFLKQHFLARRWRWCRRLSLQLLQLIDSLHNTKHRPGDDQKVDNDCDEFAKRQHGSLFPGFRKGCGSDGLRQSEEIVRKSTPPVIAPTIGMMMSLTSESTILEKAAPTTTAIARSRALPFMAKSRNSFEHHNVPT